MKHILALALLLSVAATPVFAQERANPNLYWSGLVVAGLGGGVLGWGLGSPERSVACVSRASVVTCQETGVNKMAWIGAGGGLMVGGVVMSAIGGKHVPRAAQNITVAPRLHGLSVTKRITFAGRF